VLDVGGMGDKVLGEVTGRRLLVELMSTVVVVAPDPMAVTTFVTKSLATTPSFRVYRNQLLGKAFASAMDIPACLL
jgi:hypothetical protein